MEKGIHEILIPVGKLSIVSMKGCEEICKSVDSYLSNWRSRRHGEFLEGADFNGYCRDSYLLKAKCPRFGTGEAKGTLEESARGHDIFIIIDAFNYGVTYNMYGMEVPMSPDDHFQDLKRVIAAISGKARRVNVIMPMLYEGRQHKRSSRESLDCALCLQELINLGVENIITFDAHDARVQNAIPSKGFENVPPTYQFIKALVNNVPDLQIDREHLMIISPDEGGMTRCMYYSSVLGVDLGMFYKRRDYSRIVNGRNPIISHEFLGSDVSGKDLIVCDDMISSGDSVLDIAEQLKARGARRIFVCTTFGLFCNGLENFDKAYADGSITKVFTTNLIYRPEALKQRPWYQEVDMSKYIAHLIDTINHDGSISDLLDPAQRISTLVEKHKAKTK